MITSFEQFRKAVNTISPITNEDWALCHPGLRYLQVPKGAHFIEEGKVYKEIGFVVKGLLRAYYLIDGEEINCQFFFEGHWPKAYHSFLTQTPSRMWIEAMEDTELLLISYDHLQYLFKESNNWQRFGRIASENAFIAAQLRNEMLLLDKPETRYQNLSNIHPEILERVPLYHLASYIGVKQPSLSRIRRRLATKQRL